ncbi:hypothetical protein [Streptomyces sp. NRRL S-1022]|uniref:hypothetical protein n=1 Tax=Streptomyces sp. NRRL S-1022 TaxID=1463880 RepID=UPI000AF30891|nr:hypothetical protein [Streptomyces sp. NRRL S-1022]
MAPPAGDIAGDVEADFYHHRRTVPVVVTALEQLERTLTAALDNPTATPSSAGRPHGPNGGPHGPK